MKTLTVVMLLLLLPLTAQADYWQLNVKYKCPTGYLIAQYKFRSLPKARIYQNVFRRIPKYRNCWIRYVREK